MAIHQSLNPRDFVVIDILKFFFWNSSFAHSLVVVMMTELGKLFPSIPLVAEEDSSFLRSNNLEDSVVSVVNDKAGVEDKPWARDDVLKAIDRGAKEAFLFGTKPATYWVGVTEFFLLFVMVNVLCSCVNSCVSGWTPWFANCMFD